MLLPPALINVRIRNGLWIPVPVFLLWPLLLLVVGICFVVAVAADAVLLSSRARYHHYTNLVLGVWELLAELRGLRAHINNDETFVDVDIY